MVSPLFLVNSSSTEFYSQPCPWSGFSSLGSRNVCKIPLVLATRRKTSVFTINCAARPSGYLTAIKIPTLDLFSHNNVLTKGKKENNIFYARLLVGDKDDIARHHTVGSTVSIPYQHHNLDPEKEARSTYFFIFQKMKGIDLV